MSKRLTLESIKESSFIIYGDKYIIPNQIYKNNRTDLVIYCKKCDDFFNKDKDHFIDRKQGCPECFKKSLISLDKVREKSYEIFNDKYFIKDQDIRDVLSNIEIFCNTCQESFNQTIHNHMKGEGCQRCGGNKRLTLQDMITKSKEIHGDIYIIQDQKFINCETKLNIYCKKCEDYFPQDYEHHIYRKQGCPNHPIKMYSKGEKIIAEILENKNIKYKREFKFKECRYKKELAFDFYLPDYNTCIEYNGQQHYEPIKIFGGKEDFDVTVIRDKIKIDFCNSNKIRLLVIKYNENIKNKIEEIWM